MQALLGEQRREWYRIQNLVAEDTAEVWIYDEIGFWGTTAGDFIRELSGVTASKIVLHLNSPGGDVFDGIAIFRALKDHPATIEARVDAIAASIASVIAMAGDRIVMTQHSMMMIHEPFALVIGDANDMRKQADVLDKLADTLAGIYAARAGGDVAEWRAAMTAETWYRDQEAVDAGLADEVVADMAAAQDSFDLSHFRNAPRQQAPAATHVDDQPDAVPDWLVAARFDLELAALEV